MARSFTGSTSLTAGVATPTAPFTIGMLVRNVTDPGTDTAFLSGSGFVARWQQYTNDSQLGLTFGGIADYFGSGVPSPTGSAWQWIAYSQITSTSARLRSGSNRYDFSTAVFPATSAGIRIGNPGQGISGEIAEVAYWNIALSDADAAELVALKLPNCVASGNLLHWWKLNNGSFPEPDAIGTDNLTLENGTATLVTHPTMQSCSGGGISIPVVVHHLEQQGLA